MHDLRQFKAQLNELTNCRERYQESRSYQQVLEHGPLLHSQLDSTLAICPSKSTN